MGRKYVEARSFARNMISGDVINEQIEVSLSTITSILMSGGNMIAVACGSTI